jgi:hypothetical protein
MEVGVSYEEDDILLYDRGFHGSCMAIDALIRAQGPICARLVIGGEIETLVDVLAGNTCTVLWMADASDVLMQFGREMAGELMGCSQVGVSFPPQYERDTWIPARQFAERVMTFSIFLLDCSREDLSIPRRLLAHDQMKKRINSRLEAYLYSLAP